jgi:outer membrane receptor protein involved in Fe transport
MNVRLLSTIVLSLFSFCLTLSANPNPTGSIRGTLLEQGSNAPLDNVPVVVYQGEKKTPVKVANSDENGVFVFSDMIPGEYRIEVGFLGYLRFEDVVQVLADQKTQMGNITMKADDKMLKSVEITGLRSTMKLDVDKKVFTVDQNVASAGASTSDILKNIPSVEVDAEGGISLRNSTNVIIWINGKPSGLTADNRAQILEQMPAESIDRIEVITNPSAKFSAEGSAGIINIILKKDRKAGYYGSIRVGVSDPKGSNVGGNINYSSSKWDLFGNVGYRQNTNKGSGTIDNETYSTVGEVTTTTYKNSQTERKGDGSGLFLRAGADYHLNDKHTLGLSGFYMSGENSNNSSVSNRFLNNARELTKLQERTTTSSGENNNFEVTLDYQWEIGSEHNLHAIASTGSRRFPSNSSYLQNDFDSNHTPTNSFLQEEQGGGNDDEVEFQLDYVRKFSESWKLESGWKSTINNRESFNRIFNRAGASEPLPSVPLLSNRFDYEEQQHAAYATLTGRITPEVGYQLGVRAENSVIHFTSTDEKTNLSSSKDKNYLNLFPTIFLNYQVAEGSDIQLNYSRRINRPRGRALNPFENISDSTNIWKGNPDLDPEYAHSIEVNFLKTWQKHTLSAALYHRMNDHVIQDIRYLKNDIMYQTPENVTKSISSGLEIVAKDNLFRILEATSTLNFFLQNMDGFTYLEKHYDSSKGFSWNYRFNGQLMLPKNLIAQISGFYSAPRVMAQGEMKASYSMDLGLRKSFLDRKLQVAINGQNLLNSFKFRNSIKGPGFSQVTSNEFFSRSIRLNVTWNFGTLKQKNKSENREGSQEPTMEMDGGF